MSTSFKQGLIYARSHIAMMVGLCAAFGLIVALELWDVDTGMRNPLQLEYHRDISMPAPAPLNKQEEEWAQIAWRYFERNYNARTGLVNTAENYPATTMWDTASYLMALISAHRLEIISPHTFDSWMSLALTSLGKLPLFDGDLPNKSYNAQTLEMTNYVNQPSPRGIGWSAIDIGRLLVPLHILVWHYPQHTEAVQRILQRWNWPKLVHDGQMFGATVNKAGKTVYLQEGRLGYEQYVARALLLLGLDVSIAANYTAYLDLKPQYGLQIPVDKRDAQKFDAHNYVVSDPYILDHIEFGPDRLSREFAWRVYAVQEARYKDTGILTAATEDHIDNAPYFVYNTVFVNGTFWKAITDKGEDAEAFKAVSTKAAFGWHGLYRSDYTAELIKAVAELHDPKRGWFSGRYEKTGSPNQVLTANTNAIILETLCYRQFGPLLGQHSGKATTHLRRDT